MPGDDQINPLPETEKQPNLINPDRKSSTQSAEETRPASSLPNSKKQPDEVKIFSIEPEGVNTPLFNGNEDIPSSNPSTDPPINPLNDPPTDPLRPPLKPNLYPPMDPPNPNLNPPIDTSNPTDPPINPSNQNPGKGTYQGIKKQDGSSEIHQGILPDKFFNFCCVNNK